MNIMVAFCFEPINKKPSLGAMVLFSHTAI